MSLGTPHRRTRRKLSILWAIALVASVASGPTLGGALVFGDDVPPVDQAAQDTSASGTETPAAETQTPAARAATAASAYGFHFEFADGTVIDASVVKERVNPTLIPIQDLGNEPRERSA